MNLETKLVNVYGVSPGIDFLQALVAGLEQDMADQPAEAWAKITIFVNTSRMRRRLKDIFDAGPPRLLPQIRLVTDLVRDAEFTDVPPLVPALRRRLELSQLVSALLEKQPDLAPRSALFDLSEKLAALFEEMEGEAVSPDALKQIDVNDLSGHWQRSLQFVDLAQNFAEKNKGLSAEARLRAIVEILADRWSIDPPTHPIIVAGSTGSRGATAAFMRAVAKLPNGKVILPGVDFSMPHAIWDKMKNALEAEDHPQYRFLNFARSLNIHPSDIQPYHGGIEPKSNHRNKLISLALRPAPVTDQWMVEGKNLTHVDTATKGLSMVFAPSPRMEALSIAVALRQSVALGKTAALISPDRNLTRQVTAALERWGIKPDDSAGRPLHLSAPGRLLRQISGLFGRKLTLEALLTLLKHPLTHSGGDRGNHLLQTRELELTLRRKGKPFPNRGDIATWAAKGTEERQKWAAWVNDWLHGFEDAADRALADHIDRHLKTAEHISAGALIDGSGRLWDEPAGEEAHRQITSLRVEAEFAGTLSAGEYATLFNAIMAKGEVREATQGHPRVMIWGTLEARVQGADLTILAGLNEGVWPANPDPDPWLNRSMRHQVGLLLPERRIGLSAHDFQQAIAGEEVILTRSIRDDEAETVPSRWLNRLCNLMGGLSEESASALERMTQRGDNYLKLAEALSRVEDSVMPEPRPCPAPPIDARPKEISITEVQRLIRDPYSVYARRVLGLNPLPPIRIEPDAMLRGTVVHRILEEFGTVAFDTLESGLAQLSEIVDRVLSKDVDWPAARLAWKARLDRVADWLVSGELSRRSLGRPIAVESKGALPVPNTDVLLVGQPDRIDLLSGGGYAVYDYKTGNPPSAKQQREFDKQLFLSAILVEGGSLKNVPPNRVFEVGYIGLGSKPVFDPKPLDSQETEQVLTGLSDLLNAYATIEKGYTSRRAVERTDFAGDYDHLARFGEWDEAATPIPTKVGK